MDDFVDINDLYADIKGVGMTPQMYMDRQYYDIYKGDYKRYLKSIEWDTWCTHETEDEYKARMKQREIDTHPFNKFF